MGVFSASLTHVLRIIPEVIFRNMQKNKQTKKQPQWLSEGSLLARYTSSRVLEREDNTRVFLFLGPKNQDVMESREDNRRNSIRSKSSGQYVFKVRSPAPISVRLTSSIRGAALLPAPPPSPFPAPNSLRSTGFFFFFVHYKKSSL